MPIFSTGTGTWDVTLDTSKPPFWKWFVGGRINASYNCVDRHLAKHKNKTAIHFVPEPEREAIQHITYQELYVRVNEVAALLRDFCGLKKGDRVTLHLPMVPELPITMLACARLGVIHSQVFSGFSGKVTADRIADSESRVLITMDAYRSCSRFRKICCKDATRKIHLSKQPAAENISVLIGIRWHGEGANRKGAARFGLRRVQTNISGHFCHGISYSAFAATV
jgi:acyl-coenzyme A synthetase/AMP-(fatty) acid ligase